MPYKSDKQRKFMHSVHPEIAKYWDKGMHSKGSSKLDKMLKMRKKKKY